MQKETILMDVDGVLLDLIPAVKEYIKQKFNETITAEMITYWDWDYALGIPAMCDVFWKAIWNSDLKPYYGAKEFIQTLRRIYNFNVVAVSNRTTKEAIENAERQFPEFGFDDWILCKNTEDKIDKAYLIGAKWSLEDNPKTAATLGREKYDLRSYLIVRPWNKNALALTGAYRRVFTYKHFEAEVERICVCQPNSTSS